MQKISNTIDAFFALDELANLRSPVHRLHPMAKLAVTFVFIVCVISAGRYDAAGLTVFFFYPAVMIAQTSAVYVQAFEAITGETFVPDLHGETVLDRVRGNLAPYFRL